MWMTCDGTNRFNEHIHCLFHTFHTQLKCWNQKKSNLTRIGPSHVVNTGTTARTSVENAWETLGTLGELLDTCSAAQAQHNCSRNQGPRHRHSSRSSSRGRRSGRSAWKCHQSHLRFMSHHWYELLVESYELYELCMFITYDVDMHI